MSEKPKYKTDHINIRISKADKERAQAAAEKMQMSVSEYIIYLIRKGAGK